MSNKVTERNTDTSFVGCCVCREAKQDINGCEFQETKDAVKSGTISIKERKKDIVVYLDTSGRLLNLEVISQS